MQKPKIVKKQAFDVIGFQLKTTTKDGQNFREIPDFWNIFFKSQKNKLYPDSLESKPLLGLCMDLEGENFSYLICKEANDIDTIPHGMVSKHIDSAEYAVFTAKGPMPESIQEKIRYIHNDWLPNSEYIHADTAEFELYDDRSSQDEPEVDIYIPIKKKS